MPKYRSREHAKEGAAKKKRTYKQVDEAAYWPRKRSRVST
jgi:hypothetical protein